MFRTLMAAFAIAAFSVSAAFAQAPVRYDDLVMHGLEYGGMQRRVGIYVPPSYDPHHPAPVIIALHDRYSSAKALHAISRLAAVADARGAILAYPESAGGYWNDGGLQILSRPNAPQDDIGFVSAMLTTLQHDYAIDPERVYLLGYDVGGNMAYNIACDGRLHLAGVAVVSSLMWSFNASLCNDNTPPTPILILHGARDWHYPTRGGGLPASYHAERFGVDETAALWRRVNGCGDASVRRGGSAIYASCRNNSAVAYIEVSGGEHDWFHDGPGYELNRQGVSATALIDQFFFDRTHFALPNPRGSANRARSYIVYVPPGYDARQPTPVMLMLHGRPDTPDGMAEESGMNPVAERNGFIAIYPEGINHEWDSWADLSGHRATAPQDDVAFLEALMRDLRVDLNIDPRRIYVAGFSNGAFMTLRLACTASDHFAGFASVGGELYSLLTSQCRGRPAPVIIIHGTGDRSVPYRGVIQADGRGGEPTRLSLSVQDTVAFFIRRNGCSLAGQSTTLAQRSPETQVIRFAPHGCANGNDVMFYLVNGGAHNFPGVALSGSPQPVNMDINGSEVIWDFMRTRTLPDAPAN